jgi:hypothetical protein
MTSSAIPLLEFSSEENVSSSPLSISLGVVIVIGSYV